MKVKVSLVKDGRELATEVIEDPNETNLVAAISLVCVRARIYVQGPLWPMHIDVRESRQ